MTDSWLPANRKQPVDLRGKGVYSSYAFALCHVFGRLLLYGIRHVVIGENHGFQDEEALLASRGVQLEVVDSQESKNLMAAFTAAHPEL